ncbi:hypothetical protein C4J81_06010 [Deltaproteobacteria bacterium Smac51]|nr:hypothetical protein C4J81_06010 [Deltaproteobacteria bacterium Smac51]
MLPMFMCLGVGYIISADLRACLIMELANVHLLATIQTHKYTVPGNTCPRKSASLESMHSFRRVYAVPKFQP